jgi:hypothetical protein
VQVGQAIQVVDLAGAEPEVIRLGEGRAAAWLDFAGVEDGLIWVYVPGIEDSDVALVAYDGEGVQQDKVDLSSVLTAYGRWLDRDLVSNPAGGIYRRDGDGFRRLSGGMLRAVGFELAIVHECDDALRCRSRWVESATWADPGLPDPPPYDSGHYSAIVGNDRWLLEISWRDGGANLYEIATGSLVRELRGEGYFVGPPEAAFPFSQDGRWLVEPTRRPPFDATTVIDLESGREWSVPVEFGPDSTGLLIESARLDPAPGRAGTG